MKTIPEIEPLIQEVVVAWNEAERVIKKAELLDSKVVMAAINELRYAGRRIADAILAANGNNHDDGKTAVQYIQDAHFRCLCAQHDAVDAALFFLNRRIDAIENTFGFGTITKYFPDYTNFLAERDAVAGLVERTRADRTQRATLYKEIVGEMISPESSSPSESLSNEEIIEIIDKKGETLQQFKIDVNSSEGHLDVLIKFYLRIKSSLIKMEAEKKKIERKEKIQGITTLVSISLAIFSIAVTIFFAL